MSLEQLEERTPGVPLGGTAAPALLARRTYLDLRSGGLSDTDIMAFAGELLSLVAAGVRAGPTQED